jgi:hypothetical protein
MDLKRIYSINLATWLISNGIKPELMELDEEGKCYFIFKNDSSDVIRLIGEYKKNEQLYKYLNVFSELKLKIRELKQS